MSELSAQDKIALANLEIQIALCAVALGGPGSGNWAHVGRPGKRGGSATRSGGGMTIEKGKDWLARYKKAAGKPHPFELETGPNAARIAEINARQAGLDHQISKNKEHVNALIGKRAEVDKKLGELEGDDLDKAIDKIDIINTEINRTLDDRKKMVDEKRQLEAEKQRLISGEEEVKPPVEPEPEPTPPEPDKGTIKVARKRATEIDAEQESLASRVTEIDSELKASQARLRKLKRQRRKREIDFDEYINESQKEHVKQRALAVERRNSIKKQDGLAEERAKLNDLLNPPKTGGTEAARKARNQILSIDKKHDLENLEKAAEAAQKAYSEAQEKYYASYVPGKGYSEDLKKEYDKASVTSIKASEAKNRAIQAARKEAVEALSVDNPIEINVIYGSKFASSDPRSRAINEGLNIVKNFTDQQPDKRADVVFRKAGRGRASATADGTTINVTKYSDTATIVHELGHWLEDNNTRIRNAVFKFYEKRTAGEREVSMNTAAKQVGQSTGYRSNERTRIDKFMDPYMGKDYKFGGKRYATEILSMGLELFYENPAKLARQDPEYFDFIYAVVRGFEL